MPVINVFGESGFGFARVKGRDYQKDNIHLNWRGGRQMGAFIWSKLKDIPCWEKDERQKAGDNEEKGQYYEGF